MWPKFLDTPSKRRIIFSFIAYFPIISMISGTPLPFPSIFEPTQGQIGILNGINLSISIVGSIIGVGFYLRKTSKDEIKKLDEKIGESAIAHHEELKELKKEMRDMEGRICNNMESKTKSIERTIEDKVTAAKNLEDERIRNIQNRLNRLEDGGNEGWRRKTKNNGTYDNGDLSIDR